MIDQEVGDSLKVWIRRGGLMQLVSVEVGTAN